MLNLKEEWKVKEKSERESENNESEKIQQPNLRKWTNMGIVE